MSYWHCWEELGASAAFALFQATQWSPVQMTPNLTCSGDFVRRFIEYWVQTRPLLGLFLEITVSSYACSLLVIVQGTIGVEALTAGLGLVIQTSWQPLYQATSEEVSNLIFPSTNPESPLKIKQRIWLSPKGIGLNFSIQAISIPGSTILFSFWSPRQLSTSLPHHLLSQAACRHVPPPKPSPAQSAVTGPAFLQDSQNWQLWTSALFHPRKYASRCEAPQLSLFLVTFPQAVWMKAQPEGQMICSPPSSSHPSREHTETKNQSLHCHWSTQKRWILCVWIEFLSTSLWQGLHTNDKNEKNPWLLVHCSMRLQRGIPSMCYLGQ